MTEATAMQAGVALLRAGEFLAAHECFESVFRRTQGRERVLFHALAQLSAGHHQLSLGRARAAAHTWEKALRKLAELQLLPPTFETQIRDFCQRFGLSRDGPRFVDVTTLPAREAWPCPEALWLI